MEVEVEGEDGSKLLFRSDHETVLGRGCGFNTHDRTVSRRHVSFHFDSDARVSFQVMGKNPFWVYDGEALGLFRKLDKGHLQLGNRFCFSPNTPFWFTLTNIQPYPHLQLKVSEFDPVKEFGFLVMGHEFDNYPKGMIRNVKNWEWFIEEDVEKERRKGRGKRKMGKVNEDDDWSGESEDDKDLVANITKGKLPRYSTRSKDSQGLYKYITKPSVEEQDDDDDDHETLGGFIVADENDVDEEQEQEFQYDD